jgi:hypothetical protein
MYRVTSLPSGPNHRQAGCLLPTSLPFVVARFFDPQRIKKRAIQTQQITRHPKHQLSDRLLKGFPEAITTVFPEASVQTCIVHLICRSLTYCVWNDKEAVAAALKLVYRAESEAIGRQRFEKPIAVKGNYSLRPSAYG